MVVGSLVGLWTITTDDLSKTDDYGEFIFETDGELTENNLTINPDRGDDKMSVSIVSPECGIYFNESTSWEVSVFVNDSDDDVSGTLKIDGVEIGTFGNDGVIRDGGGGIIENYTFNTPGNVQVVIEANNSRGMRARAVSSVMVLDTVDDGKYVAACIDKPEDYQNFEGSIVEFDASTSRAVDVVSGVPNVIIPGVNDDGLLGWYWTFYPEGITRNFAANPMANTIAYNFTAEFPIAGDNSAALRLEFA